MRPKHAPNKMSQKKADGRKNMKNFDWAFNISCTTLILIVALCVLTVIRNYTITLQTEVLTTEERYVLKKMQKEYKMRVVTKAKQAAMPKEIWYSLPINEAIKTCRILAIHCGSSRNRFLRGVYQIELFDLHTKEKIGYYRMGSKLTTYTKSKK